MSILIYFLKSVLISGLLTGYYALFLRNRSIHGFNRIFLLSIPLIAFILPAFQFNLPAIWRSGSSGSPIRLLGVGTGSLEAFTVYASRSKGISWSWQVWTLSISLALSALLFLRFLISVRYLSKLRKNKPDLQLPEADIYIVSVKGTPFSYFNNIFWAKDIDIDSFAGQQILRHELYHVRHKHSFDMLFAELVSIVCWFNPFFHWIRRELQMIHEYAADAYASLNSDEYAYAGLLLSKASGNTHPLSHPFFKTHIKRRITMITQSNKTRKALSGRVLTLPLILLLIGLFSFKFQNHFFSHSFKTMRVVIDAGHGGSFTGALSGGLMEKDINLLIAKKIQSLSKEYSVDVIMSRETDMTPGGTELRQSLEYIAALPKNKNADLFVSIHINATDNAEQGKQQTEKTGFQIYLPPNPSEVYTNSVKFGSIMTDVIKSDYAIESELKQPANGNVYILKNATVPALLIECGYMDNPNDMKYLQDEKNQEKIARDILEGIRKYGMNTTSFQILPPPAEMDSTAPLKIVEVQAAYPGGQEGWGKYLSHTLKYPEEAVSNEIQGDVMVEFVVHTDGSVTDVKAISGPKELRAESVRVIAQSGNWVAAMDHGARVDSYTKQPIKYRLQVK